MSQPHFGASIRQYPLLQICHGTPGLLILFAYAGRNRRFQEKYWTPTWTETILLGTDKIWAQGLLSKGGSLCHGISGNAWPLLMMHDLFEHHPPSLFVEQIPELSHSTKSKVLKDSRPCGDYFLSRALAMLLECRNTLPFRSDVNHLERQYRVPDNPFSLFEGLAGTCCAWQEACLIIKRRTASDKAKVKDDPTNIDPESFTNRQKLTAAQGAS